MSCTHRLAATYQGPVEPVCCRFSARNIARPSDSCAQTTSLHQPDVTVKQPATPSVKYESHGHVRNLGSRAATGTRKRAAPLSVTSESEGVDRRGGAAVLGSVEGTSAGPRLPWQLVGNLLPDQHSCGAVTTHRKWPLFRWFPQPLRFLVAPRG